MTMALNARQRQHLKGLAHPLAPVVRVGKGRISERVVSETTSSLEAHELIKVRLEIDEPALRREAAGQLAGAAAAELVGTVGKIAILYRARAEKPKIKLPA